MSNQLPKVVLSQDFLKAFTAQMRTFKVFTREEGGYLIGSFHGDRIQVEAFYHDTAADSSVGDISLSTDAFDRAAQLVQQYQDQTIIGTWHLHPPGYGAHYSTTDFETLFIDRMVLNATDPDKYESPWVHVIVPGLDDQKLHAYTLDILPDLELNAPTCDHVDRANLKLPPERQFGLLVERRRPHQSEFYPSSRRLFPRALRAGRLTGLWRICRPGPACLRWEKVFVENFIRKLQRAAPNEADGVGKSFTYCRLVPHETDESISVQRYEFQIPRARARETFVRMPVTFPPRKVNVVVENPNLDGKTHSFELLSDETVSEISRRVKQAENMRIAPVLWTLLNSKAADSYRDRTRVEEFGKVFLPDDVSIGTVLAQRETPDIPIYWESSELSPEIVRHLRTDRFARMGYDVDRLHQRHVLIAGLGLLGCGIAHLSAMVSVGKMTLIDSGFVDWVNVYRQSLYAPEDVGNSKVAAAAQNLRKMGIECDALQLEIPSVLIPDVHAARRSLEILSGKIQDADMVVGVLDSFSSRAVLQVICRIHSVPFLAASLDYLPALGMTQGSIALLNGDSGPCYGCGSGLKMQKDRGACTNAPIEFPGIVNSMAAKYLIEALQTDENIAPLACRVYHDHRIEIQPLGDAAESCEVCSLWQQAREETVAQWTERLIGWLIS